MSGRAPGRSVLLRIAAGLLLLMFAGCGAADRPAAAAEWTAPTELPRSDPLSKSRLAFDSDRTGNFELYAMSTDGSGVVQLTSDRSLDSWGPRISPDRTTAAVQPHSRPECMTGTPPRRASGPSRQPAAHRSSCGRPVFDGWGLQGHAEWAPDGRSLVMVGGPRTNAQIFVTDRLGQQPRAVTDRPGTNIDPRFTPDGTGITFVGCPKAICTPTSHEIYQIPTAGGQAAAADRRPAAGLRPDLLPGRPPAGLADQHPGRRSSGCGTSGSGNPTVTVRRLVGDDGITSRPQFSADGRFVFMHRIPPGGNRFDVFRIRVDGSGLTNLTAAQPGNNEYPSP